MQQRLVDGLERHEKYSPDHEPLLDPFQYVASANYVVLMLLHWPSRRAMKSLTTCLNTAPSTMQ